MPPNKSYIIWFTPRTGSTLLCKSLEETGIAGKPGEFFNLEEKKSFCSHYDLSSYQELRKRLWSLGSTRNGDGIR